MPLKEASYHSSAMGVAHFLQCGEDNAPYDLVPVPDASQIALYEMRRSPAMQMAPIHTITDPPP